MKGGDIPGWEAVSVVLTICNPDDPGLNRNSD